MSNEAPIMDGQGQEAEPKVSRRRRAGQMLASALGAPRRYVKGRREAQEEQYRLNYAEAQKSKANRLLGLDTGKEQPNMALRKALLGAISRGMDDPQGRGGFVGTAIGTSGEGEDGLFASFKMPKGTDISVLEPLGPLASRSLAVDQVTATIGADGGLKFAFRGSEGRSISPSGYRGPKGSYESFDAREAIYEIPGISSEEGDRQLSPSFTVRGTDYNKVQRPGFSRSELVTCSPKQSAALEQLMIGVLDGSYQPEPSQPQPPQA